MPKRFALILLLLAFLIALSFYSTNIHPWIHLNQCLENPSKYDGQQVTIYREPRIGEIYPDGFQLLQERGPSIRVYADTAGLRPGEYIGLTATFHKEGYLHVVKLLISKKRRYKIWLSVLPVLLIGGMFVRYYRLRIKPFQIELRKHA